jgi:hypothetical protein
VEEKAAAAEAAPGTGAAARVVAVVGASIGEGQEACTLSSRRTISSSSLLLLLMAVCFSVQGVRVGRKVLCA